MGGGYPAAANLREQEVVTSFDTDKKHLTYLLDQIEQGDAALPDFQRDFVWRPARLESSSAR